MAMQPAAETADHAFRYAMCMNAIVGPPGPRPLVPTKLCTCFVVHAKVNGCEALMMVNTGSTTNFVSPAFATVAKLAAFMLESQLALQLGCVGSCSKITHGVHAPVCIGNVTHNTYFNVLRAHRSTLRRLDFTTGKRRDRGELPKSRKANSLGQRAREDKESSWDLAGHTFWVVAK